MIHAAYLMPLLPLGGFVLLALFGRRLGDPWAGWLGTATVAGSFVVACITYAGLLGRHGAGREFTQTLYTWIAAGNLHVTASLLVDPLSMTMALFVTGVSMLIHLYSIGYMRRDEDFAKFFAYLNLFVASMLLLVLGGNLLFTFVGWEGVGACSYWLVAFWFERDSAASAGKKAFVFNRIGDVGFLIAMFLLFSKTGTLQYLGIFARLGHVGSAAATAACLLLFLAATGKSAQIPLFTWLPDAMEGPTPVSALIHAATMVTAGVFVMARMNPLLALSHDSQLVIACIGAATAFVAATIACAQNDIKKVLAFSTVSQLGYMFLAVGSGAYVAAIFLMVAHAFFKADLFLGAGSVIHGMHDEQDLKKMGGLARYMRLTAVTFAVGWLAIVGFPGLSGFWAKGDVLVNAWSHFSGGWRLLYVVGLVTALLTAYYMSRLFVLAFTGDERWRLAAAGGGSRSAGAGSGASAGGGGGGGAGHEEGAGHGGVAGSHAGHGDSGAEPHESPWVMTVPLVVLAALALLGGLLDLPWHTGFTPLAWLDPVLAVHQHPSVASAGLQWTLSVLDAVVALIGIGLAFAAWRATAERPELEPSFLRRVWFVDDVLDATIGRPGEQSAEKAAVFDRRVIDGAVEGIGAAVRGVGSGLRRVQTGFVRQYAVGIALGLLALLAFMLVRTWA